MAHRFKQAIFLRRNRLLIFFPVVSSLWAVEENLLVPGVAPSEWQTYFTGPLLAPGGTVLPVGHYDIEPYLFFRNINGMYDSHWTAHKMPNIYSIQPVLYFDVGLTQRMDFAAYVPAMYQWSQGQSDFGMNDIPFFLNFQLFREEATQWFPGVKLSFSGLIPAGKYQNLNPDKHLTDWRGNGSWGGDVALIFYKLVHIEKERFLSLNFNFNYAFFSSVHVHGFNAFGGGFGTKGRVRPGNNFTAGFSFEYSFSRYWAIANDLFYFHSNKDTFSGNLGCTTAGTLASSGQPSSEQITLSPAIEYNFNQHLGIIGGIWFTVIGRNAQRFQNAAIAFNYYY